MKKIGKILKVAGFIAIFSICLSVISVIFQYEHEMEPDIAVKEFYELEKDSIQILSVGTSHTTMGFSPMECYKNTNITSFNLSTASQPIELSYYLIEEALKTQSPKVVIFEVGSLFYNKDSIEKEKFRYVIDSMPLSLTKVKIANCYADYCEGVRTFSIGEALCPIYFYHNRWKELNEEEFYVNKALPNLKGQVMRTYITEFNYDLDAIDKEMEALIESDSDEKPTISEKNKNYLKKMKKICDDNNMKLLLVATPTNRWSSIKQEAVEQLSSEMELDFINMNLPDGELIDFSTDMADGNHVNAKGAIKTTKKIYEFIQDNYKLKGESNKSFDESIKYYDAYQNNMVKYCTSVDYEEYLTMLAENKEDLTIIITAKGESTTGLTDADVDLFKQIGCEYPLGDYDYENAYIAVIKGGKQVFEKKNKMPQSYTYNISDDKEMYIYSDGTDENGEAIAKIDDVDYAINGDGLNIVVINNESGLVVDSVSFSTKDDKREWYRTDERSLELILCKEYRNWVASNY